MKPPFFLSAFPALAAVLLTCSSSSLAQAPGDLVAKGDGFDRRHQAAEALESYLPAEKQDPNNVSIVLKIARQYRHLMTDAGARGEKLRLGEKAMEYSQRAATLAPNDSEAQLSVAITLGKMLPLKSSKEQLEGSRRIKDAAERAIRLNSRNDLAWHILGRWHLLMSEVSSVKRALARVVYGSMPTATFADAARAFEKAAALNPNRLMHRVELGRTYANMGRKADAERELSRGLAMPSVEKDDPETKARGRKILATL